MQADAWVEVILLHSTRNLALPIPAVKTQKGNPTEGG